MACRCLVSIDDDLYEQDEMFRTILTTDGETVTITKNIAIDTILDDDGELYVQELTQTHRYPSTSIRGLHDFSNTAWFSSCLINVWFYTSLAPWFSLVI